MPQLTAGDIDIYYEIHGAGAQTITLIRGLGADLRSWFAQVPELSKHFRTLVFDNRGSGRTSKPDTPYTTREMASDVNNLLDALQIKRSALLGISMGGMIAQEFAINYSEKLSCLILGCTSFGGRESVPIPHDLLRPIPESALFSDETIRTNRGVIATQMEARSRFPTPPFALARQAAAILNHDAMDRLEQIRVPTLVVTGRDDRLIPPANSRLIAAKIPGAILKELPGGHLFTSEYPDVFNRDVIEFVEAHRT